MCRVWDGRNISTSESSRDWWHHSWWILCGHYESFVIGKLVILSTCLYIACRQPPWVVWHLVYCTLWIMYVSLCGILRCWYSVCMWITITGFSCCIWLMTSNTSWIWLITHVTHNDSHSITPISCVILLFMEFQLQICDVIKYLTWLNSSVAHFVEHILRLKEYSVNILMSVVSCWLNA